LKKEQRGQDHFFKKSIYLEWPLSHPQNRNTDEFGTLKDSLECRGLVLAEAFTGFDYSVHMPQ
jgi:hypothetical protein